jgi:hypothetical protein
MPTVAESGIVAGHDSAIERGAAERDRRPRRCEIRPSGRRDAADPRSSVTSRRLWGAHSPVVAGGHDHAVDATIGTVANQQSHARSKQQYDGCRQPRVIRLANRPGDAAVPQGAARLLGAWQTTRPCAVRVTTASRRLRRPPASREDRPMPMQNASARRDGRECPLFVVAAVCNRRARGLRRASGESRRWGDRAQRGGMVHDLMLWDTVPAACAAAADRVAADLRTIAAEHGECDDQSSLVGAPTGRTQRPRARRAAPARNMRRDTPPDHTPTVVPGSPAL